MRHLLVVATLLLGTAWAWAQAYPSQQPSDQNSGAQTQSQSQPSAPATSPTTIEGCLGGSAGSYTLTAKDGTIYQLTGNTDKLDKHVGHEVQITGTESPATSTSGTGSQTGTATSPSANSSQKTFDVTSFKHLAKSCSMSGGK